MQNKPQLGHDFDASAKLPEQDWSVYREVMSAAPAQQNQQKVVPPTRHWDDGNTSHYCYEG